jgi:hypothetical protein
VSRAYGPARGSLCPSPASVLPQAQEEEDDGIKVPGIIPPNVLPLQSESAAGTVPRYSTAIERLLEARGERTTARLGFKGLGDAGATEVRRCCLLSLSLSLSDSLPPSPTLTLMYTL